MTFFSYDLQNMFVNIVLKCNFMFFIVYWSECVILIYMWYTYIGNLGRWLCDQRQAKRGTGGKFKLYPEREALLQKLVDEGKLMWIVKNLYGAFQSKRYTRKEDGEIELLDNDEEYDEDGAKTTSDTEGGGEGDKTELGNINFSLFCNAVDSGAAELSDTVPQGGFVHIIYYLRIIGIFLY